MRILYIHERFGALGGAETNILVTAREFKRRGHEVGLLHGPGSGWGEHEWHETFSPRYPLPKQQGTAAVGQALASFHPDLLYVHKMADIQVLQALVGCGRPVVRMVHDHDLYCMRSYKYNPLTRKVCHRAATSYCVFPCGAFLGKNSGGWWPFRWHSYRAKKKEIRLHQEFERLVVASHYMKEELLRNGFESEKVAICPPVPQGLKTSPTSSFSERNWIIYAGQVIRGKGVDILLQALKLVEVPFQCLIFGEGNHLSHCKSLARKLKMADRVQFHGFVPQEKLGEYYREASLGVMSSVWPEPFGAVGLEAMSHGLPVVAFDVGGIREWLIPAYNGFLVPWMDQAGFAARVQQLLTNKSLARQMGQRAQRLVSQKFNFANYVSNLENLFHGVLVQNRERVAA